MNVKKHLPEYMNTSVKRIYYVNYSYFFTNIDSNTIMFA